MGDSTSRKDVVLPTHRQHGTRNPQKPRTDYNYDKIPIDIENPGRPGSTFELQSPSRTMDRTRSSYRQASLGVLDIN